MQALLTRADQQLEALTQTNLHDMLNNLGLGGLHRGRRLIEQAFTSPARLFARTVIGFDQRIAEVGLQAAAAEMLARYTSGLDIIGADHTPSSGPVLFAANHPGMADSLACFAAIGRPDLRVVANDRAFTRLLPNVSRRLICVPDDPNERLGVARQVTRHLNPGGAVFINPAGQIEPDPACMPGAVESLANWSDSLALFVRRTPNLRVVTVIVSGVILPSSLRHPLTRIRRQQKDRERLAATLQLLLHTVRPGFRPLRVRIEFGPARTADDLAAIGDGVDGRAITRAITADAARLIENASKRAA